LLEVASKKLSRYFWYSKRSPRAEKWRLPAGFSRYFCRSENTGGIDTGAHQGSEVGALMCVV
jgi:hypothetical protein